MKPKISVCMPVYNQARYLPEAIESVLAQDLRDFELIIIDDHSTDDSAEVIGRYAARDQRIRFQTNDPNLGMVSNWNKCLAMANGGYIKYLFGDDKLLSPAALGRMAALLDANRDVSLVASARHEIDETSRVLKVLSWYEGNRIYQGREIITDCILEQRNRIGEPSAVMFRRSAALRGFDPRYRQIVDLEMWFSLLEQGCLAFIDEPLAAFRVHPQQQTRQNLLNLELISEPFLLLADYGEKPYLALSSFERRYMRYVPLYAIWKLSRKHRRISAREAWSHINERMTPASFFAFYPLFKLARLLLGFRNKQRLVRSEEAGKAAHGK